MSEKFEAVNVRRVGGRGARFDTRGEKMIEQKQTLRGRLHEALDHCNLGFCKCARFLITKMRKMLFQKAI
jgi:hypothetical protein